MGPRKPIKKPYVRHQLPYTDRKRRKKLRPSRKPFFRPSELAEPVRNLHGSKPDYSDSSKYTAPGNNPSPLSNNDYNRPVSSYKDYSPPSYKSSQDKEYSPTLYRWDDEKDGEQDTWSVDQDNTADKWSVDQDNTADKWWSGANDRQDNRWYKGDYQDEFRETHDYYSLDVVPPRSSQHSVPAYYDYNHYDYKQ